MPEVAFTFSALESMPFQSKLYGSFTIPSARLKPLSQFWKPTLTCALHLPSKRRKYNGPPAPEAVGLLDGKHSETPAKEKGNPQQLARDCPHNEHPKGCYNFGPKRTRWNYYDTPLFRAKPTCATIVRRSKIQIRILCKTKIRSTQIWTRRLPIYWTATFPLRLAARWVKPPPPLSALTHTTYWQK